MKLFDDSFDIFNDEIDSVNVVSGNVVSVSMNGSRGKFQSLEDILETDSTIEVSEDLIDDTQALLSIDQSELSELAYFGSIYAVVESALSNIKNNYPNGFSALSPLTGTNTLMLSVNNIYKYGSPAGFPSNITSYTLYELTGSSINNTFEISSATTGLTYLTLYLDGQPLGGSYDYIIAPKDEIIKPFIATLSDYEKELLNPPYERTNYWPRDSVIDSIIVCEGSPYESFASSELNSAILVDNNDTNFLWRKLYPNGQKILDNNSEIAYKLIQTYAKNFDTIKKYQDHLKYMNTIGYSDYNHIPKDLVLLLANQWNWILTRDLNQSDISEHIYPSYDNYATGSSIQQLSANDINFERWRRILANLVYLYKRKGTAGALRFFANLYGLPERLFKIEELIENIEGKKDSRFIVAPSKIIVHTDSGLRKYVVPTTGEIKTYPYPGFKNTKYLNVNITPFAAIEYEFFDWGWADHPGVTDVNGNTVIFSGLSEPNEQQWFEQIEQSLIPSDGSARYSTSYPLLENEGLIYYEQAATPWSLSTLEPYINFLDNNWATISDKLLPAATKLLSMGTLYRNPFWQRQKYQWNDSELDPKSLPLNEEVPLQLVEPIVEKALNPSVDIDAIITESTKQKNLTSSVTIVNTDSNRMTKSSAEIYPILSLGEIINEISDAYSYTALTYDIDTGHTYSINSPLIYPNTASTIGVGTTDLLNYSDDMIIQSNNIFVEIPFSAENISESGYTNIKLELFNKADEKPTLGPTEYSILNVINEYDSYGVYKISPIYNLEMDDFISITSSYAPYINNSVRIISINQDTNEIKTEPKIGLFNLPLGEEGSSVNWIRYIESGIINRLNIAHQSASATYDYLITILKELSGLKVSEELRNQYWIDIIVNNMPFNPNISEHKRNKMTLIGSLSDLSNLPNEYILGSIVILEFIKINPRYSLTMNQYQLINSMVNTHTKATFKRIISYFDWSNPIQTIEFDNDQNSGYTYWTLPSFDLTNLTDNYISTSGNIRIGYYNEYNKRVLNDKEEYFYRIKVETHAKSGWTEDIAGIGNYSGRDVLSNNYELQLYNSVKYYGYNFTFFSRANQAILIDYPLPAQSPFYPPYRMMDGTASIVTFNGVGDTDKLELQYYKISGLTTWGNNLTNFQLTGDTGDTWGHGIITGWTQWANEICGATNTTGYYNTDDWDIFNTWVNYWNPNLDADTPTWGGDGDTYWENNPNSGSEVYVGYIDSAEYSEYSSISQTQWIRSGITIPIEVKEYADDGYLYTNETVLEPYTAYWWRVVNYRNKKNLFGHNLEIFTTTEPNICVTGPWDGIGNIDGEVDETPRPPKPEDDVNFFDPNSEGGLSI